MYRGTWSRPSAASGNGRGTGTSPRRVQSTGPSSAAFQTLGARKQNVTPDRKNGAQFGIRTNDRNKCHVRSARAHSRESNVDAIR
jgi:hypothetical protein